MLLGGCVTPASGPSGHEIEDSGPTTLHLGSCEETMGDFTVPAGSVSPFLPEGFAVAPAGGEPTGKTAVLAIWGSACEESSTDGAHLGPFHGMGVLVWVVPPDAFRVRGIEGLYFALLDLFVEGGAFDTFDGWGLAGDPAQVALSIEASAVAEKGHAAAERGSSSLTLETLTRPLREQVAASQQHRFYAVENRQVVAAVNFSASAGERAAGEPALVQGRDLSNVDRPLAGFASHWYYDVTWTEASVPRLQGSSGSDTDLHGGPISPAGVR
jgi:hypothetical protein